MAWRDDGEFTDRRGHHPPLSDVAKARHIRRKLARGEPLTLAVYGAEITAGGADLLLWNRLGRRRADAIQTCQEGEHP